jgi:hypothetical protein
VRFQWTSPDEASSLAPEHKKALAFAPEASVSNLHVLDQHRRRNQAPQGGGHVVFCASVDKVGRPHLSTDAHPIDSTYDDDFIHFSKVLHSGLFQEARQFYESGLSLEQVAGRLKKSKTFIRSTLIAGGVSLRPSIHTPDGKAARNQGRMAGAAPYGFTYLRGQLVVHPDEVENLLFILELWHQGQGARAISRLLNDRRIPSKTGKLWDHSVVTSIIDRREKHKELLVEFLPPKLKEEWRRNYGT